MGWTVLELECGNDINTAYFDSENNFYKEQLQSIEQFAETIDTGMYEIKSINGHNYTLRSITFGEHDIPSVNVTSDFASKTARWTTNMTDTSIDEEDRGQTTYTGRTGTVDTSNNTITIQTTGGDNVSADNSPKVGDFIFIKGE